MRKRELVVFVGYSLLIIGFCAPFAKAHWQKALLVLLIILLYFLMQAMRRTPNNFRCFRDSWRKRGYLGLLALLGAPVTLFLSFGIGNPVLLSLRPGFLLILAAISLLSQLLVLPPASDHICLLLDRRIVTGPRLLKPWRCYAIEPFLLVCDSYVEDSVSLLHLHFRIDKKSFMAACKDKKLVLGNDELGQLIAAVVREGCGARFYWQNDEFKIEKTADPRFLWEGSNIFVTWEVFDIQNLKIILPVEEEELFETGVRQ